MPADLDTLKQIVTRTLGLAKQNLEERGQLVPVVLLFYDGGRQKTIPAYDKMKVGKIIEEERPDSFVYISEVWIRDDVSPEERELTETHEGWDEISKRMRAGRMLAPSESPNRREAIMLVGGTGTLRVSLQQGFHRDHEKIVFDNPPQMSEMKVGDSLVDWDDEGASNPSRWLTTAPAGGRIIPFEQFEIWIPEGWKMNWEPNETDPKRTPVWYREKNPHGGLRVRLFVNKPSVNKPRDVLNDAKLEEEKRRTLADVNNVSLVQHGKFPILSWTQPLTSEETNRPWLVHAFKVFDAKGSILVAFQHGPEMDQSQLREELASTREIANRIVRR